MAKPPPNKKSDYLEKSICRQLPPMAAIFATPSSSPDCRPVKFRRITLPLDSLAVVTNERSESDDHFLKSNSTVHPDSNIPLTRLTSFDILFLGYHMVG